MPELLDYVTASEISSDDTKRKSDANMPIGIKFFTILATSIAKKTLAMEEEEIVEFKIEQKKYLDQKIQKQKEVVLNYSGKIYSKERRVSGRARAGSMGFVVPKID